MRNYSQIMDDYYKSEKIGVDYFDCKYRKECHQGRQVFKGADTHIGSNYGDPYKIVIISLDRGQGAENLLDRRKVIESLTDLNPHMRGTKETLTAFLGTSYNDVFTRFSMINSAKCCLDDGTMNKAPAEFFDNCRGFVLKEIEILEPDLIITQGNEAKLTLNNMLRKFDNTTINRFIKSIFKDIPEIISDNVLYNMFDSYISWIELNGKKSIVVHPVHPSERYGKWSSFKKMFLPVIAEMCNNIILQNLNYP